TYLTLGRDQPTALVGREFVVRRQIRGTRFDHPAKIQGVAQLRSAAAKLVVDGGQGGFGTGVGNHGAAASSAPGLDHSSVAQRSDRLAQIQPADPELQREL